MTLTDFIRESNLIESISRPVRDDEIVKYQGFMKLSFVALDELCEFQAFVAPDRPLRTKPGMNVRVGNYVAPEGGPNIQKRLDIILRKIRTNADHPWMNHCAYETLHPFLDGNGRTGRALWAWQMLRAKRDPFGLGFLRAFYYQTLEHSEGRNVRI